jgi:hypothetical protein
MVDARNEGAYVELAQLRREILFLKKLLLVVAIVPAIAVLAGTQPAAPVHAVEAEQFVLVGKNKKILAKLFIEEGDFPTLNLYDKDGACRTKVDVRDLSGGFHLMDPAGFVNATLSTSPWSTQLAMSQPSGKHITLVTTSDGKKDKSAQLLMGGDVGPFELELTNKVGWSKLSFLGPPLAEDDGASEYLRLSADVEGGSDITMMDKKQIKKFTVETTGDGKTAMSLFDEKKGALSRFPSP